MNKLYISLGLVTLIGCGSSSPAAGGGAGGSGGSGPSPGNGGSGGSSTVCVAGQQVECPCPGGMQGAHACKADGSGYLTCACTMNGAGGATAGGSAGMSSSGASGDSGASGAGAAGSSGQSGVDAGASGGAGAGGDAGTSGAGGSSVGGSAGRSGSGGGSSGGGSSGGGSSGSGGANVGGQCGNSQIAGLTVDATVQDVCRGAITVASFASTSADARLTCCGMSTTSPAYAVEVDGQSFDNGTAGLLQLQVPADAPLGMQSIKLSCSLGSGYAGSIPINVVATPVPVVTSATLVVTPSGETLTVQGAHLNSDSSVVIAGANVNGYDGCTIDSGTSFNDATTLTCTLDTPYPPAGNYRIGLTQNHCGSFDYTAMVVQPACTPNDKQCHVNDLLTCQSNGNWLTTPCQYGCLNKACRDSSYGTVGLAGSVTCETSPALLLCATHVASTTPCCWNNSARTGVCNATSCPGYNGSTTPDSSISCDGPNDCSAGQVCCFGGAPYNLTVSCTTPTGCDTTAFYPSHVVCDPGAPSCATGTTCKAATIPNFAGMVGTLLYTCQ